MTSPNHPPGTLCWFDCGSTDRTAAKSFYTQLFGWTAFDAPSPGSGAPYTLLKSLDEEIAGLYQLAGPQFEGVPSHWMTYVAVADVDATVKRARDLGAEILWEPTDVAGVGRISMFRDPTGAAIAAARFDPHPGTSPKGPFGWSELATKDTQRATVFYAELFGWTAKPDAHGPYTEFQVNGRSIAGMMPLRPEQGQIPSNWTPYVMVEDCDTVASRAKGLGGKLHVPPTDIENVGRFGVLADPTGAVLGFIKLQQRGV